MNILIVSAVFPPEPVVSGLLSFDIAEKLIENGDNVTVICPRPTRPFGHKINNEDNTDYKFKKVILNSYTCPDSKISGRLRESYSFGKHSYKYIKNNHKNIDLIYANTWPLFAQFLMIRGADKYNIPVLLHIQDIYPESIAEKQSVIIRWALLFLFVPLDKLILRKCSKVIAISPPMKEYLVSTRQLDNKKVMVVRNWQNDIKFRNGYRRDRNQNAEFIFMYLGNISPSASVETLIHAFGRAKLLKCKLIIAGEGSDKPECLKAAQQYPDENIDFITASIDKVHIIQQEADILLLSLKKGIAKTATPSKLTAYMFSGKPIIACVEDDSDTASVILESESGWIAAPQNIDLLTQIMRKVVSIPGTDLRKIGENAFNYATTNLSKEKNLLKVIGLIKELAIK